MPEAVIKAAKAPAQLESIRERVLAGLTFPWPQCPVLNGLASGRVISLCV